MLVEPKVYTAEVMIERDTSDGSPAQMPAFLARPQEEPLVKRPALLLIQEAFGVNHHIRDVCQRFARQGYVVVSPDLYYRNGHWLTFSYENFEAIRPVMQTVTEPLVMGDISATLDYIQRLEGVDADRIGVIGYCMGGRLAYMIAAWLPERVQAGAFYYGGGIVQDKPNPNFPVAPIERTDRIQAPMIGFFGGQDKAIPKEVVERIDRALEEAGVKHEVYFYPEAGHGFFCDARKDYDPRAAVDAWHRTLNWFRTHLGEPPPVAWKEGETDKL